MTYEEWCEHTPISAGDDTVAIAVGPNHKAIAALIVKSANKHDALVAACEDMAAQIGYLREVLNGYCSPTPQQKPH